MSYVKVTESSVNKIRFYYPVSSFVETVDLLSSMKAKANPEKYEQKRLSEDEKTWTIKHIENAMLEIGNVLSKIIVSDSVSNNLPLLITGASVITAGSFVPGNGYKILVVGTTNFTLIGATSSTIGVSFVATGVGAGTGTATNTPYCSWFDVADNELARSITLNLIDTTISQAIEHYILHKWYIDNVMPDEAKIHYSEFQNKLNELDAKTITLRILV